MRSGTPWGRWIVEGLVVVGGILLAFGIEAWWAERQERAEEQRLLVALEVEFQENVARVDSARLFHEEVRASTLKLMELSAAQATQVSADSLHRLLGDLSWWYEATGFATGAMNAILMSGKLSLLRDDELQRALASWQRAIDYVTAREIQDYSTFTGVWMPYLRENAHLTRVSNQITRRPGTQDEREPNTDPVVGFSADPRQLLGRRDFQNVLLQKRWVQTDILRAYDRFEVELNGMLELIGRSRDP